GRGVPARRVRAERSFASSTESAARRARSHARPTNESSRLTPSTREARSSSRTRVGRRFGRSDRGSPSKSWLPAPPNKQNKQVSNQARVVRAWVAPPPLLPNFGGGGMAPPGPRGFLFLPETAPTIAAVRGATVLGDWNENRRHSAREHRDIDRAGLCPN